MGYSGPGKISGHTGTEHKHRKAFSKIKSYQQSQNRSNYSKSGDFILPIKSSVPTNYQQAYQQDRKFKLFFKLPVFLITIIVIGFVFVKSSSHYKDALNARNYHQKQDLEAIKMQVQRDDYLFLVHSGYYYYRRKQLSTAQSEFIRALSIDEYGKDARIGLTKTLIERCIAYHEGCEEIQPNLDFIRGMKYLPELKIKELEDQFKYVVMHEVSVQRN